MAQIFHPSFNTLSRVMIFGAVFFVAAAAWAWDAVLRSPYVSQVGVAREQPIPFSHRHHVADVGIDCRYCHTSVEEAAFAGIPSSKTCMTCHSQVWKDAEILALLRSSYQEDRSIRWIRVHDLPDFVYFDHSIHVAKGVGCSTCHGLVDEMPLTWRTQTLQMDWCLSCHRDPVRSLRPRSEVFDLHFDTESQTREERERLAVEYKVTSRTDCSICHR